MADGQTASQQRTRIEIAQKVFPEYDLQILPIQTWSDAEIVPRFEMEQKKTIEKETMENFEKTALLLFSLCPRIEAIELIVWDASDSETEEKPVRTWKWHKRYDRSVLEEQYGTLEIDAQQSVEEQLQKQLTQVQPMT